MSQPVPSLLNEASNYLKVLFYSPYAGNWYLHTFWEATIAHALRHRGAEVRFLGCDSLFKACDIFWGNVHRTEAGCMRCQAIGRDVFTKLGLDAAWLGDRITLPDRQEVQAWVDSLRDDELLAAHWDGCPLGEWCKPSMTAHFRQPYFPDISGVHAETLRHYLWGLALAVRSIERTLEAEAPDVLVTLNGTFFSHAAAMELARRRGIRVIIHERGQIDEALRMAENALPFDFGNLIAMRETWKDIALSTEEIERAALYVLQRRFGVNTAWFGFSPPPQPVEELRQRLGIPQDRAVISLFTTSQSEAATAHWIGPYAEQFEWIRDTFAWMERHPEYHLVVRIHPNEDHAQGTNRGILEQYRQLAATAPTNVSMVYPKDDVSSYTLVDLSTAVLVYNSTVGVEAAATWGTPILAVAVNPYSEWGFTHDLKSKADYLPLLEHVVSLPHSDDMRRRALRYLYRFALWSSIPFPLVSVINYSHGQLNYSSVEELAPGREPNLDRIADSILGLRPLYRPPSPAELQRSTEDEDAFLAHHPPGPTHLVSPPEASRLEGPLQLIAFPDWSQEHWKAVIEAYVRAFGHDDPVCLRLWVDPRGPWGLEATFEAISAFLVARGYDTDAIADIELTDEPLESTARGSLMSAHDALVSAGESHHTDLAAKLGLPVITVAEFVTLRGGNRVLPSARS